MTVSGSSLRRPLLRLPNILQQRPCHRAFASLSRQTAFEPPASNKGTIKKHEWLVLLPDQTDAAQRRVKNRPKHLAQLSKIYPPDFLLLGGPYLGSPATDERPLDMLGSVILVWATSPSAVEAALRQDVFTECNVWDWSKAQILPFKSTIRKPLEQLSTVEST